MARLLGALPPGSYLALSHPANDIDAAAMAKMADLREPDDGQQKVTFRARTEVAQRSSTGWSW